MYKRLIPFGWKCWNLASSSDGLTQKLPPFFFRVCRRFPQLMYAQYRNCAIIKQGHGESSVAVLLNSGARWLQIKINFFLFDALKTFLSFLFFQLQGLIADRSSSSSSLSGPNQCCCTYWQMKHLLLMTFTCNKKKKNQTVSAEFWNLKSLQWATVKLCNFYSLFPGLNFLKLLIPFYSRYSALR